MNDLEVTVATIVEKLLRQLPTDNTFRGAGLVGAPFAPRDRDGTSAGPAPVATIDGSTVGGDLSGVLPNPTVDGLQGRDVASTAPTDGQALAYSTANSQWEPSDVATVASVDAAGYTKELLMQDGVTNPPVPIETEAQDDWLYQD